MANYLSHARMRELRERMLAGDRAARDEMVVGNMKLVPYVAARFFSKVKAAGRPDLEQAGYLGLIRAVEDWRPDRGRFSTKATYWIRAAMRVHLGQECDLIRIPRYLLERGRAVNPEYAAAARLVRRARHLSIDPSIDPGIPADTPDDDGEPTPPFDVAAALPRLTRQGRRVITWRYGLDGEGPREVREIAAALHVTKNRVYQILDESIGRLRALHARRAS